MPVTMYDAVNVHNLPTGAAAYAGYVGGRWPTFSTLQKMFPKAHLLDIAISADEDATCLDVEPFDATPAQVPDWFKRQVARKVFKPVIYASVSRINTVFYYLSAAGVHRDEVRLWSAHYAQGEHICGPRTCGQLPFSVDGTQWTSTARGISLDQSLLGDNFFTVPGPNWTYGPPVNLRARPGHTNVELTWDKPANSPVTPAYYQVDIYHGVVCNQDTLVHSYPRLSQSTETSPGSLTRRTEYTAHVFASGPHGTHVKPYVFAAVTFTTGG